MPSSPSAALSPAEGRLEPRSGNLQCSYHGWEFGPDGRCAAVPQADSPQQAAAALSSPRSCVAAYPVRQAAGLLWVWMDAASSVAAASRPLPLPAELSDGSAVLLADW
jgi:pheophorbide a oxygenase